MSVEQLAALLDALPEGQRRVALSHASWVDHRVESYGRLAFLGDSVLGLAIAEELYRRFPRSDLGRLNRVLGPTVSGRACAEVAEQLRVRERVGELVPDAAEAIDVETLVASERAMASITEAIIGACYLQYGYERTAEATVAAFTPEIERASESRLDSKSALQELLAKRGAKVSYTVTREDGPPHDRRFEVEARVEGDTLGAGSGRSKKEAEQAAANEALERLEA